LNRCSVLERSAFSSCLSVAKFHCIYILTGEFEAYAALENALSKTRDTHARIQLKTALKMQRQRMMEKWRKVSHLFVV